MTTWKHSGNAGDIIYMLPTIARYSQGGATLYLNIERPAQYAAGIEHPLKNVMLDKGTAEMLVPLCKEWDIEAVIGNPASVDYDLDKFREHSLNLSGYDIRRWILAEYPELIPPVDWDINVDIPGEIIKTPGQPEYITVNLSTRYRNSVAGNDDKWRLLQDVPYDVWFIGLESEYHKFAALVPKAIHKPVSDFLEMAEIMWGGIFHFGNQSSPFAIAEIYDMRRALELSPYCPNVVSQGSYWNVIYNTENMAYIIERFLK
jgi:hypothetical protein